MPLRLASLAFVVCALAISANAEAAPKHRIAFRLEYEAPSVDAACPDADELALMIAAEFGYLVVRTDVSPVVRVTIRRSSKRFEAEMSAPELAEGLEPWHGKTDTQGSCRELAYDVATLIEGRLGGWCFSTRRPHRQRVSCVPMR